ncbi:HPr kinase/phosphorylase [Dissostichus eleginoides]|uniref:HPr kinase/phosphorylase n=1 Tax=Dissostichus eleginoides TaxID=100907 RepID=A0AAD9F3I0_DISEL|nr:HPr kinase/phosphorylase [Dissostichus eleginoides]
MMKCVHVAVAVLSLLSAGQSAPVSSCETLIHPIEVNGREQLLGKWTPIAECTDFSSAKLLTNMLMASERLDITAANESDTINVIQSQKMLGRCYTFTTQMTLVNSTLSLAQPFPSSVVSLRTGCPDCLILSWKFTIGGQTYRALELLSRRNTVTADELKEFMRQAECLNLPPPTILHQETGFCPDDSPSIETATTHLTSPMNDMGSEVSKTLERIMNSDADLQNLFNTIRSSIAGLKEN